MGSPADAKGREADRYVRDLSHTIRGSSRIAFLAGWDAALRAQAEEGERVREALDLLVSQLEDFTQAAVMPLQRAAFIPADLGSSYAAVIDAMLAGRVALSMAPSEEAE